MAGVEPAFAARSGVGTMSDNPAPSLHVQGTQSNTGAPHGFQPQFPQNSISGPTIPPPLRLPFNSQQGLGPPSANNTTLPKPPIIDSEGQVWFEACSAEGKVYYFNAKTRETKWTKPETEKNAVENKDTIDTDTVKVTEKNEGDIQKSEVVDSTSDVSDTEAKPQPSTSKINEIPKPPFSQSLGMPPNVPPPFIMPPMMRFPGSTPPGIPPPFVPPAGVAVPPGLPRFPPFLPGFRLPLPGFIPKTVGDWTEHRLPDGRLYYYNNKTKESKWDKPEEFAVKDEKTKDDSEAQKKDDKEKSDENNESMSKAKEESKMQKPIASKPVTGTGWHLVWTGDGKVFFFHPTTKTSIWERPKELENNSLVDEILKKGPTNKAQLDVEKSGAIVDIERTDIKDNGINSDDVKLEESEPESKKPKLDSESEKINDLPLVNDTDSKMISAEEKPTEKQSHIMQEAQVKKAIIPLEERMTMFTHLLREKEVSAFSTWEKELHKILFDPRYLLLTMKDRKTCYEKYVKVRAAEERKERIQRLKEKKEEFKKLLEEFVSSSRVSFSEFASKNAKDERYKRIEKMRDRESLFNEYMIDFRKNEREKLRVRDGKLRKGFYELLSELNSLTVESEWSKVKGSLEADRRYELVGSSSKREQFFRDYIKENFEENSESKEVDDDDKEEETSVRIENDAEVALNEKNERIEVSLRKREEEVRAQKELYEKDREKERGKHLHDKAVQHFKALLSDMVKDIQFTWKETRRTLRKDPRWSALDILDKSEKESLFNSHIGDIKEKRKKAFRKLLDSADIPLDAHWREVRKQIKDDPRYSKYGTSELREEEFESYLREKLTAARTDFRELLRETKLITYKSKKLTDDTASHLKDIKEVLKKDMRYHVMSTLSHERDRLLQSYIEELHKRGPPPPPTATNPSARYKKD